MRNNKLLLLICAILVVVVLPVSAIMYSRSYAVPAAAKSPDDDYITNAYVLQDTLPPSVIDILEKQVQHYYEQRGTRVLHLTVVGTPKINGDSYDFRLQSESHIDPLDIKLEPIEEYGVTNTKTIINLEVQDPLDSSNQ